MLLLEEKNEDNRICYFDSSNILACKYKLDTSQLAVIFKDGSQYVYESVSNYTFQRFKIAESQGEALNEYIKGKFKYTKVEYKIPTQQLYQIIDELKNKDE